VRALTFVLCAAIAGIFSIPGTATAQADQTIVMVCTSAFPGQLTITIDLAAKVVTDKYVILSVPVSVTHGTVTQVSDTEITFNIESDGYLYQGTLNRYTGILISKPLNEATAAVDRLTASFNDASCQKKQKQF